MTETGGSSAKYVFLPLPTTLRNLAGLHFPAALVFGYSHVTFLANGMWVLNTTWFCQG